MSAPDIQARLVEGGSRELDDLVLRAVGFRWNGRLDGWSEPGGALVVKENPTTSVDAALALAERVLPGWFWSVRKNVTSGHLATVFALNEPPWTGSAYEHMEQGTANTPAAALCIAILKAKALQDGRDG